MATKFTWPEKYSLFASTNYPLRWIRQGKISLVRVNKKATHKRRIPRVHMTAIHHSKQQPKFCMNLRIRHNNEPENSPSCLLTRTSFTSVPETDSIDTNTGDHSLF